MLGRKRKGPLDRWTEKVKKLQKKLKNWLGKKDKGGNKALKILANVLIMILIKTIGDSSGGSSARGKL